MAEFIKLLSGAKEYVSTIIEYGYRTRDSEDVHTVLHYLGEKLNQALGVEAMTTIADRLIEQGKQAGIQQGVEKGKQEVARQLRAKGLEVDFISNVTGLAKAEIEQLCRDQSH